MHAVNWPCAELDSGRWDRVPVRWWVPIAGIDPSRVRVEFIHAAVSGWFDTSLTEHAANDKPYAVSPLADGGFGSPGIEIATFTDWAEARFHEGAQPGDSIRLGNQIRRLGRPRLMHRHTWSDLLASGPHDEWLLEFVTPTTFRSGDRATPLPDLRTILAGLSRSWKAWSDIPLTDHQAPPESAYVSDLCLRSTVTTIEILKAGGQGRTKIAVPGCVGRMTIRCDDRVAARSTGPLLELARYSGVGSMTRRGFGVTRVVPTLERRGGRG